MILVSINCIVFYVDSFITPKIVVGEITGVVGVFSQHVREVESQLIDWQTPTLKKSTLKRSE